LKIVALVVALAAATGVGGYLALRTSSAPPAQAPVAAAPQAAPAAQATCLLPGPPPVPPDGATSTAADMSLGHDVIQGFVNQLEAYQACLNNKVDHPAPGVTDGQKDKWIEQGNAAVDQAHALADAFSAQLKIFKARPPVKQ
jgi:pyocin large subunit-like protein